MRSISPRLLSYPHEHGPRFVSSRPLLEGFAKDDCITQMDVCLSEELCYWPQVVDFEQLYVGRMNCRFGSASHRADACACNQTSSANQQGTRVWPPVAVGANMSLGLSEPSLWTARRLSQVP